MAKYYLCSTHKGNHGGADREEAEDITEEEFQAFQENKLDPGIHAQLLTQAVEMQGFEWWLEKEEDEEN